MRTSSWVSVSSASVRLTESILILTSLVVILVVSKARVRVRTVGVCDIRMQIAPPQKNLGSYGIEARNVKKNKNRCVQVRG